MKCAIAHTDDADEAREIHSLAFPGDSWVGDDHEYWIARDARQVVTGFASAIYWPDHKIVFLSRAAVTQAARGNGLHRRLIHTRLRWARRIGAHAVVTYTLLRNYESMGNLIKAGFRFHRQSQWKAYHWYMFPITHVPSAENIRACMAQAILV